MTRPATVWEHLPCDEERTAALARALDIDPVVARVLVLRGVDEPESANRFLHPAIDQLHDPFLLADLRGGVERLLAAIARKEKIAVHGDYDVDGITSTVMLRRALELLGGDVIHFIPERMRDGYGLQSESIERLHAMGVGVVVSVDCGIRSQAAARRARELGIDLVITDHHEPEPELPPALAVINPRRQDCPYPEKNLAGAGVALKLVHGLCLKTDRTRWLAGFLKLAAIGTVADVVPLTGENRVIASLGLDQLTRGRHAVGLQALLDVSGLSGRQRIGGEDIGFQLAPRVNAAGRMSTPDLAARLLLTADEALAPEARALADQLDTENRHRREEQAAIVRAALERVADDEEAAAAPALVVWGTAWHRGVIGIVASKLVEAFYRPVVVLTVDGDVAYGSGRSIPGFDLLQALEDCADLFTRFGGHRQAAGVELPAADLPAFRSRLAAYAAKHLEPQAMAPRLALDGPLPLTSINGRLLETINTLEPFGAGNRRPRFHAGELEVVDGPRLIKEQHLGMTVQQGKARFRAIAWRAAAQADLVNARRHGLQLAFSLSENTWRGVTSIELSVADIK